MRVVFYLILAGIVSSLLSCTSYEGLINYHQSPRIPTEPQYVKPDKTIVSTVRDPATRFLPWLGAAVSLVALLLSLRRL